MPLPISPRCPISRAPLAFVDVETTGLAALGGDRICEVAVLRTLGDSAVDAFQSLIDPGRRMDPGALAIHGIGDAMLAGKPRFAEVTDDLLEVMNGAILVGHNVSFDLEFLRAEFARAGRPFPQSEALCTLQLARRTYRLQSYSLERLAIALGIRLGGHGHRAMHDVLLTRAVFQRLAADLERMGIRHLGEFLAFQARGSSPTFG